MKPGVGNCIGPSRFGEAGHLRDLGVNCRWAMFGNLVIYPCWLRRSWALVGVSNRHRH
jgi:hypothetical protein